MALCSCVITGASTGVGEACALRLDAAGWRVFAGVRREEDATRIKSQLVVDHALTSAAPRTRYLVGADAKMRARIGAFVPDRLRDRLFTRVLGLPARDSVEGAVR